MESLFAGMFSPEWFAAFTSIVLLDLILSGDNAILIALACQHLPEHHKGRAIIIGGFGAVLIRILCTLFATGLLAAPYLEFIGGALLLYIAVKLLTDHKGGSEETGAQPTTFWAAVRTILIADFIMSIDNVLSLAGVANTVPEGKWSLIICGLLISIPIVLCGAQFFLVLMKKVPALVYAGAAILAYTAAELMTNDKALGSYLLAYAPFLKGAFIAGVLGLGLYLNHRWQKAQKSQKQETELESR